MKLEFNISKGKFWVLVVLLVISVAALVYAKSVSINPGHSTDEIEGLEEKIKEVAPDMFREMIEEMVVEKVDLSSGGANQNLIDCTNGKTAIGCSVMREYTIDGETDTGWCNVKEDKTGCSYTKDIESDSDGGMDAYCYCI